MHLYGHRSDLGLTIHQLCHNCERVALDYSTVKGQNVGMA